MFRAIRDYDGSDSSKCISLVPGDNLSAVHTVNDVWFIGHNERSGETGAFPIACVEVIGAKYTPSPARQEEIPNLPEKPAYANFSKMIQERKERELQAASGMDPEDRSRTLSMQAKTFDAARLRQTKPEKTFTIRLVKSKPDGSPGGQEPGDQSDVQSPGVFKIPLADHKDSALSQDPYNDSKFQHSLSVPESEMSWMDSSFEQSYDQDKEEITKSGDSVIARDSIISLDSVDKSDETKPELSQFQEFKSSTDRLFVNDQDENKVMKALFGVIAGLVTAGLLFVVLVYSFGYTFLEAGVIVAVAAVIMAICLALSSLCRCIMALLFPNFFTGKGRAVFLCIIYGILLSNPISNIMHNIMETGNSLACFTELAANQTRAINRELAQPISDVSNYINAQEQTLQRLSAGIRDAFSNVNETLKKADEGVENATFAIASVAQQCKAKITEGVNTCNSFCSGNIISSICTKTCGEIFKQLSVCDELTHFDSIIFDTTRDVRAAMNEALSHFEVNLEADSESSGNSSNSSKALPTVQADVNTDVGKKTEAFQVFFEVCKKLFSLSLALIFAQAFWYLRNYLSKDGYDNIYITKQFRQMDRKIEAQGKEAVLPLKKRETDVYANTASMKLNCNELANCKVGLFQVLIHFSLCFLVVLFDASLYFVLGVVRKYGNVELDIQGQGRFEVNVKGNGPIAEIYKIMMQSINMDQIYTTSLNIGNCLPNPSASSICIIPVLILLYIATLCLVFLRGYGMRLRRKMSAFYYPEQEQARLEFLHRTIRHKRAAFLKFLRQQIKSSHKECAVKNKLCLSNWLIARFSFLAMVLPSHDKIECTSCAQNESSFHGIQLTKCSGENGGMICNAVYCQDCLQALVDGCPLCSPDDVELRQ